MPKIKQIFAIRAEESPEKAQKYQRLPKICLIAYGFAGLSLTIYILSRISPAFADFFNENIAQYVRIALSFLTVWLPFSLSELAVIALIPVLTVVTVYAMRHRADNWKTVFVFIGEVMAVVALIFTLFTFTLGTGYGNSTVDEKLGLERNDVTAQDLYDTSLLFIEDVKNDMRDISYYSDGFSVMPYSTDEMNSKLMDAYDKFCADKDWISNFYSKTKPVMLSDLMSYTHITGVYAFFFGEANINIAFPDFTIPYTAAHELAHQRGMAREDEANFIAYLVCIGSDDPYIRYSADVSMLEYLLSALYSADKDLWAKAYSQTPEHFRAEQSAYSEFFAKYERSVVSTVSGAINDTYLRSQGTAGSASYGMVVDLAVAYKKEIAK